MSSNAVGVPIYIAHYKPNVDRLAYLQRSLPPGSYELITAYDREEIAGQHVGGPFDRNARNRELQEIVRNLKFNELLIRAHIAKQPVPTAFIYNRLNAERLDSSLFAADFSRPPLTLPEVSLFLKHVRAWELLLANGAPWALIAEDDIVLKEDSLSRLQALVASLPERTDYVDVGGGAGLHPELAFHEVTPGLYLIDPPCTRTTCAYLMNRRFAEFIVGQRPVPRIPVDFFLSVMMKRFAARVLWLEPTLFLHGSELETYRSSIR